MLRTTPEFIESQRKGSFAAFIRNVTDRGLSLQFPFGYLEQFPRATTAEMEALRDELRKHYAVKYSEVEQVISEHVGGASAAKAEAKIDEKDVTKVAREWAGDG